jgi:hypothetical protein
MSQYSFELLPTSARTRNLVYEAVGRRLVVELQLSGAGQFDWVGCEQDFLSWTEPVGETISTDQGALIRSRLKDWSLQKKLRIGIGPCPDRPGMVRKAIATGPRPLEGKIETAAAPPRKTAFARFWAWFWRTDIDPD